MGYANEGVELTEAIEVMTAAEAGQTMDSPATTRTESNMIRGSTDRQDSQTHAQPPQCDRRTSNETDGLIVSVLAGSCIPRRHYPRRHYPVLSSAVFLKVAGVLKGAARGNDRTN